MNQTKDHSLVIWMMMKMKTKNGGQLSFLSFFFLAGGFFFQLLFPPKGIGSFHFKVEVLNIQHGIDSCSSYSSLFIFLWLVPPLSQECRGTVQRISHSRDF